MAITSQQREIALETLRDFFDHDLSRLTLSVLIILSLVPVGWVSDFSIIFFGIFAVELSLRLFILLHDLRHRSIDRVELTFFFIDVVATLSFLPIELLWDDARYLRLLRLSRMLLLLGYWGPVMREVWFILMKRERRYQIFFVVVTTLILSFISAILLHHFRSQGIDFNNDGKTQNDGGSFWMMLWWSYRQIQDPGNMLKSADASVAFLFSVALTTTGMFIFSFLIGIGTSVVEELVKLGKERRLGLRRHTVICNLSPYSQVLLEELVTYYAKSFRSPRVVTLGSEEERYSYMLEGPLHRIRYRQGRPTSVHDLKKVDADLATRVILLSQADREISDSEVVSQILSVREVNPDCDIHAELYRPDNVRAALEAGGSCTVPVLADRMVGLFLANIVLFPGIQELYWQLLTSRGDEIYTCLYDRGAMAGHHAPSGPTLPFGELLARGHAAHGVIPLGYLLADDSEPDGFIPVINPGSPRPGDSPTPPAVPPVDRLIGFFGVADHFERVRGFVESMPDVASSQSATPQLDNNLQLSLCPAAINLQNILICGFHSGIIDFCEQLVLFCQDAKVFIMVPQEEQICEVIHAFTHHRADEGAGSVTSLRVHFEAGTAFNRVRYVVDQAPLDLTAPGSSGQIHVVSGDWSDEQVLLSRPSLGYDLQNMDAVLLTYSETATDPDARTALGLLKLIHLRETRPEALKDGMRIVCEVISSEKAELFRNRFGRPDSPSAQSCHPVTIVPAKRLRNALVAQSMFVPGIANIFSDLLCESGQEICKLLVDQNGADPDQSWTFSQLLVSLYHSHGLLLLGVELWDPAEERRVVVNPQSRVEDHRFTEAQLQSIFAVGDSTNMEHTAAPCEGCQLIHDDES